MPILPHSDDQLEAMLAARESDLVELKENLGGQAPDLVRRAICAFANDLPNHGRAGMIFVGADDRGVPTDLEISGALLLNLAHCKTDGNIVPPPTMTVARHKLSGGDVAVVTVWPSDSPPVRYRGRIWTRTGPRKTLARAKDERVLSEKRRHRDAPFDAHVVKGAELADLDLRRFQYLYLPLAFDKDVLDRNDRTIEERLSATKMIASADDPTPTVVGILTLCPRPMQFIAGAYVQFLRFDGLDRAAPIVDAKRFDGPIEETMREIDGTIRGHIRTSVDIRSESIEVRRATYALESLKELVRNAVMHRAYEGSNAPVQISWFRDRIEIINSGGPYGEVTEETFGRPGLTSYRNPNLAEAMRVLKLVQRYGAGIPLARSAPRSNCQPGPEFEVDSRRVGCTVRARADWRGKTAAHGLENSPEAMY